MKTVEVVGEDGTTLAVVVECPMFWEEEGA